MPTIRRRECWFFFFQAEDGIRDGRVTGVQTCALPICLQAPLGVWGCNGNHEIYADAEAMAQRLFAINGMTLLRHERSEERRVGKECRCRWSRERLTQKGVEAGCPRGGAGGGGGRAGGR